MVDKAAIQQMLSLLPIFINSAMVNSANSWMSNAVYFMTQPNHQPSATVAECGLMASFYHIGRFLLAIPGGLLADKYGIKYMIISIGCIQVMTWTALSVSHSIWIIFVVRFFQGCAATLSNTTGGNTIGEICSPKYRGIFIGLNKSVSTLGNVIQGLLASIFCSYSTTVYATTVISLLFFPTVPWIIESPSYLLRASKYEESERTLAKIRKGQSEEEISAEYESLKQLVEQEETMKSELNWLQYLALRSTRRPLICCICLNILIVANGSSVLFLYASVILPPNEYISNNSYPLIMSLIQFGSSLMTAFLIDAFPRRHLFMFAGFLSLLIQASNGIVYYEYSVAENEPQRNLLKWTFLIGTFMFWALSSAVLGPLNMIVKTEILPLSIRGFGYSISSICQATSAVVCFQLFTFIHEYFGIPANFAVFAVSSFLIILVVYFFVPETRGKTLTEIQINHQDSCTRPETYSDHNTNHDNR